MFAFSWANAKHWESDSRAPALFPPDPAAVADGPDALTRALIDIGAFNPLILNGIGPFTKVYPNHFKGPLQKAEDILAMLQRTEQP